MKIIRTICASSNVHGSPFFLYFINITVIIYCQFLLVLEYEVSVLLSELTVFLKN